jgi:hypothetical protein
LFGFDFAVFEGKKAIFDSKKLKCIVSGGIFDFLCARGRRLSEAVRGRRTAQEAMFASGGQCA